MAHTPGPWWVETNDDGDKREVYDGFGHTATVYGDSDTAADNASLIAAAPELLAALNRIVDVLITRSDWQSGNIQGLEDAVEMATNVIDKAEGRSANNAVS